MLEYLNASLFVIGSSYIIKILDIYSHSLGKHEVEYKSLSPAQLIHSLRKGKSSERERERKNMDAPGVQLMQVIIWFSHTESTKYT